MLAYSSKKLRKAQANYSSFKGELTAMLTFLRQWRYYLQWKPTNMNSPLNICIVVLTMLEDKKNINFDGEIKELLQSFLCQLSDTN